MSDGARVVVLACAGHDPSGGAGVDADREAIEACGATARTVVTTNTDQDGTRVRGFSARPAQVWCREAEVAIAEEPAPSALKFGLLSDREAVAGAARLARLMAAQRTPVVVDPVLAASGGERFLDPPGVDGLLGDLVPSGVVLTPNLHEAAELTGRERSALIDDPGLIRAAAAELLDRGAAAVVLKGGHGSGSTVRDWVCLPSDEPVALELPRVPGSGIHGSGCRHASALATGLAQGRGLVDAARSAARYLAGCIAAR